MGVTYLPYISEGKASYEYSKLLMMMTMMMMMLYMVVIQQKSN